MKAFKTWIFLRSSPRVSIRAIVITHMQMDISIYLAMFQRLSICE